MREAQSGFVFVVGVAVAKVLGLPGVLIFGVVVARFGFIADYLSRLNFCVKDFKRVKNRARC